jgi:hypothetical protein
MVALNNVSAAADLPLWWQGRVLLQIAMKGNTLPYTIHQLLWVCIGMGTE